MPINHATLRIRQRTAVGGQDYMMEFVSEDPGSSIGIAEEVA